MACNKFNVGATRKASKSIRLACTIFEYLVLWFSLCITPDLQQKFAKMYDFAKRLYNNVWIASLNLAKYVRLPQVPGSLRRTNGTSKAMGTSGLLLLEKKLTEVSQISRLTKFDQL